MGRARLAAALAPRSDQDFTVAAFGELAGAVGHDHTNFGFSRVALLPRLTLRSRLALRTGVAFGPRRAGWSGSALLALGPLRTGISRIALGPLRAGQTLRSLGPCIPPWSHGSLRAS